MLQALGARERAAGDDDPPALGEPGGTKLGERCQRAVVAAGRDEGAAEVFEGFGGRMMAALLPGRLDERESLEADGLARGEAFGDLRRREQKTLDRHGDPFAFRRQEIRPDLLEEALEPGRRELGLFDENERFVGQIVEDRLELGLDQRRERLGTGRDSAAQERIDQRIDLGRRNRLLGRPRTDRWRTRDDAVAIE